MTDAKGKLYQYTYDAVGLLIRDEDPAGGFKTLARTNLPNGHEVTLTTAEGQSSRYRVEKLSTGDMRHTTIDASGLATVTTNKLDGTTITTTPDGTVTTRVNGPDPRFGMEAPLIKSLTVQTPAGLRSTMSQLRVITQMSGQTVTGQIDSVKINGRIYRTIYDGNLKQFTDITPEGRQAVTGVDNKGRMIEENVPGVSPLSYTYNAQGRLTETIQADRRATFIYDSLSRLVSATDPLLRTTTFAYDSVGRITQQVLPGMREISYLYDRNGNLISLTPPGKPAHLFDHTDVDLTRRYTPPLLNGDTTATKYVYNRDKRIIQTIRPDSVVVNIEYDTTGCGACATTRPKTINFDRGALSFAYDATTGLLDSLSAPEGNAITYTYDGSLPKKAICSTGCHHMMNYFDFDLLIERAGDKYKARVLNSPAGQAMIDFSLPFSEMELENFLLKIGRPRRSTRSSATAELATTKAFGDRLFRAVFDEAVHNCFHRSLDEVKRQKAGLRLRLRLAEVPELANVPWEYLYYNSSFDRFLNLSTDTPIVRYIDLPEPTRPLAVQPPIRILTMLSSPYNLAKLDVEQEWDKLNQALQPLMQRGLVKLERLEKASLGALQKHLRRDEYHIFHYIGHGDFDTQAQDGVLILEDDAKQRQRVSGHNLGMLLHDKHTLGLVLLNACEGARHSTTDPFADTAQSLVRQGIPAVIAMQFEVTDQAAITLSQVFYETLAEGYPIDYALTEARKAIFAECNNVEWGTPVLHTSVSNGRIFNLERDDQSTAISNVKRSRIFISYKRNVEPDESLALRLYEELKQQHNVFI
ncbi:MAG: CHAT domain-containing protein, partial [Anaerolineae bacterium]|nr:CHAT domain-containing protein [Anaerolineae bacterium]